MFFMTKKENLKWLISEDIAFVTLKKFVTSLFQKLKALGKQINL